MAVCYRLTAPRNLGKIPKGYVLQVVSTCTPKPNACDVEEAIKRAGFTDVETRSYRSSGNWLVEEMK